MFHKSDHTSRLQLETLGAVCFFFQNLRFFLSYRARVSFRDNVYRWMDNCHLRRVSCNPAKSPRIYAELRRRDASPKISLERVLHKVQVVKPVNICARLREPTSRFNCWELAAGIQPWLKFPKAVGFAVCARGTEIGHKISQSRNRFFFFFFFFESSFLARYVTRYKIIIRRTCDWEYRTAMWKKRQCALQGL